MALRNIISIGVFIVLAASQAWASPLARLTLLLHESESGMVRSECAGVLVASDVMLTSAACFDFLRENDAMDRGAYDAYVEVLLSGQQPVRAGVTDFTWHPSYRYIDCRDVAWTRVCQRAERWCSMRRDPSERNDCTANRSFIARSFVAEAGQNLALVLLNRRVPVVAARLLSASRAFFDTEEGLTVISPEPPKALFVPLVRAGDAEVVLEDAPNLRFAACATVAATDSEDEAVVAVPSHWQSLPDDPATPRDFVFTRLDLNWMERALRSAERSGQRAGHESLRVVERQSGPAKPPRDGPVSPPHEPPLPDEPPHRDPSPPRTDRPRPIDDAPPHVPPQAPTPPAEDPDTSRPPETEEGTPPARDPTDAHAGGCHATHPSLWLAVFGILWLLSRRSPDVIAPRSPRT